MRSCLVSLVLAALAAQVACGPLRGRSTPPLEPFDVLILGGRIVDGAGNPWYLGDLAITGDRIARVGSARSLAGHPARRTIDAAGLVVAPGFIDMLGHSEHAILRHPTAISKITQGITTEITGEVSSAWPIGSPDDGPDALATRRWDSLDGYFHFLEANGTAINLGTYVGAASIRRAVLGDASRAPSAGELARMGALIDSAMRDGAMGFSTGLIYAPSTFFTTDELIALTRHAARFGGGYASHIRSEGERLHEALAEAIRIGAEAGAWVQIRHLKASGEENWGKMAGAIALIDSARRAGIDVTADQYPYPASGTGLSAILPTWLQAGGRDSMLARLADSSVRARLRDARDGGDWAGRPASQVMINSVRSDTLRRYEGMRLDEVGRLRGQEPYEAAYDILLADSGGTSAIYFTMSEDDLRLALRQPWITIGQDAGATTPRPGGRGHPRGFGTFPRILGRYVREDSVLTLEDAVRKMTSLAAQRVGLEERGVLKRGMFADVVIFDPDVIIDRATFEEPQQLSVGVRWVFVNGVAVLEDGVVSGALPGRALRGPGWKARR